MNDDELPGRFAVVCVVDDEATEVELWNDTTEAHNRRRWLTNETGKQWFVYAFVDPATRNAGK